MPVDAQAPARAILHSACRGFLWDEKTASRAAAVVIRLFKLRFSNALPVPVQDRWITLSTPDVHVLIYSFDYAQMKGIPH